MNIDELTIGQAKELAAMFSKQDNPKAGLLDGLIGKHVIVRSSMAGVFLGVLKEYQDTNVSLENSRRLWYWSGASSLSELAKFGVARPDECKFPCVVPSIIVNDVCEVLEASKDAVKSIISVPEWKQRKDH